MRAMMVMHIQYELKSPATRPNRMLSDGPPSVEDAITSRTCEDSVEVKIFTSSGMTAPASVPQLMISESFHQSVGSPPRSGIRRYDARKVMPIETIEVSHTRNVSGASKSKWSVLPYLPLEIASFRP